MANKLDNLKQRIIKDLEELYWPTWDPSPKREKLAQDVRELFGLPVGSLRYYRLKADLIKTIGRNAIEEYSRGKDGQGMLTLRIFDDLTYVLSELEEELRGK